MAGSVYAKLWMAMMLGLGSSVVGKEKDVTHHFTPAAAPPQPTRASLPISKRKQRKRLGKKNKKRIKR